MPSLSSPSRRAFSSRTLAISIAILGLASASLAQSPTPAAVTNVPVAMGLPTFVKGATLVGHYTSSKTMSMSISLAPSNRAAYEAYARGVSDPKSPFYHKFLNPVQIGERFGASASTINTVVAYLKGKGMTISMIPDNRLAILFKGTASKAETAFSTKLNNYKVARRPDGGPTSFVYYATVPKVPSTFASKVISIGGLQSAFVHKPGDTLNPTQLRSLYGVVSLYGNGTASNGHKGQGVSVGIVNYDGYRLSNVPLFCNQFGLPTPSGGAGSNVTPVNIQGDGRTYPATGEADLDIQCVLSMAPLANVYVYDGYYYATGGTSFQDDVDYLARIVQRNEVDILTESYGLGLVEGAESFYTAMHDQHNAMSIQGMTFLDCSGDTGTEWPGYPNIEPDVLVVGGSVAAVDASGNRATETGWDGSGSGWREFNVPFNVRPSYQTGSAFPTDVNRRLFPDLALHATGSNTLDPRDSRSDGTSGLGGYYWFIDGQLITGSGTSASSPTLAGQLALVLQQLKENNAADTYDGKYRLGPLNATIYGMSDTDRANVFYDVLGGDAGPLLDGSEALGAEGWDFVTGWGAPNTEALYNYLLSRASEPVLNASDSQNIYTATRPTLQLGTLVASDGNGMTATGDGQAMTVQTVRQSGVGQVAAVEIGFTLANSNRRSASFTVAMSTPKLTTGFLYLFNYTTNVYDVVSTIAGDGTTKTTTMTIDLFKYLNANGQVSVLARALKPTRLGNVPFNVTIDQATVTERVPRAASSGS